MKIAQVNHSDEIDAHEASIVESLTTMLTWAWMCPENLQAVAGEGVDWVDVLILFLGGPLDLL